MRRLIATAAWLLLVPTLALAQAAQSTDHQPRGDGYFFFGIVGIGSGSYNGAYGLSSGSTFVVHGGGGGGEVNLYHGLGLGGELGYAHWSSGASGSAWIPSVDLLMHLRANKPRSLVDPFLSGGPSAYIPTQYGTRGSPAFNFGGGVNLWLSKHAALRCEFRDYVAANSGNLQPGQNYASFRFGVTFR
jgi:hypothetical protein